jgi:hypothetical protein
MTSKVCGRTRNKTCLERLNKLNTETQLAHLTNSATCEKTCKVHHRDLHLRHEVLDLTGLNPRRPVRTAYTLRLCQLKWRTLQVFPQNFKAVP